MECLHFADWVLEKIYYLRFHANEFILKKRTHNIHCLIAASLPLSHLLPENPSGQMHTSGDIHVPLFSQAGSHIAVKDDGWKGKLNKMFQIVLWFYDLLILLSLKIYTWPDVYDINLAWELYSFGLHVNVILWFLPITSIIHILWITWKWLMSFRNRNSFILCIILAFKFHIQVPKNEKSTYWLLEPWLIIFLKVICWINFSVYIQ